MLTETKLRMHIISKSTVCYRGELLTNDTKQRQWLEAAQMRFRRPALGLTRRDQQRNADIRNKLNQDNTVH